MKKKRMWLTVFSVLLMLILWGVVQPTLSPAGGPGKKSQLKSPVAYDYTDQLIVKYRNSSLVQKAASNNISALNAINERVNALSSLAGVALTHFRFMSGDGHIIKLPKKMTLAEAKAIARSLRADPNVEYAVPDRRMFPMLVPNDTEYVNQWHYKSPTDPVTPEPAGVNLPGAWDITTGASGIVVAVIDTGIVTHADLAGRTVAGYDFISNAIVANDGGGRDNNPSDPGDWITSAESNNCPDGPFCGCPVSNSSWHGTHVAGTIGALSNNSLGIAGINWTSKILPVRVLGKCGGDESDMIDGMRWAAGLAVTGVPANANPAKVLNMSLGGPGACSDDPALQTAIDDIMAAGVTIVVAAGNSSAYFSNFSPAGCRGVITVLALDRTCNLASYSNYHTPYMASGDNPLAYLSAPGGDTSSLLSNGVLSTLNSGTTAPVAGGDIYQYYQGTSMATPHVAGIASLMLSVNSNLLPAQIAGLISIGQPWPGGSNCSGIGYKCGSLVNAGDAVTYTQSDMNKQADLALTVAGATPNTSPILAGTPFFHTVNVINNGPVNPYQINLTWTPSGTATVGNIQTAPYLGYRYDYYSDLGIGSGFELVSWENGMPSNPFTMTFHAIPLTTGTITYTVNISSSMTDPDLSNNSLTFTYNVENPVPAISSIIPTSTAAGGSAFTLYVNGSNFTPTSTIQWEGTNLPTSFVTFTQLTATISAADIATAGTVSVTVVNLAPGGGTSNTSTFTISTPPSPSPSPTAATAAKTSGNICFIATAAFGSPLEKHVQILRDFRDRILLNSAAGKSFVNFYYEVSPPIAQTIAQNEALRLMTRWSLMPVVGVAYLTLHWGGTATLFLMLITLLIFIGLAWTVRKKLRNA